MPSPEEKTAVDEFMISEYQTIASAHFDLHSGLRQNFRFYLGLAAVPFSVWAVAFKDQTDLFKLPNVLQLLFLLIAVLGFMMFLQMVHTRFDIILYTRAVNGVRAYFVMRASEIPVTDFARFLKLPIKMSVPPYRESPGRAYWWQFLMIGSINSVFLALATRNYLSWCWTSLVSIVFFGLHIGSYYGLSSSREKKEILGNH